MLTISLLLVAVAFICTIANAAGKCPLWVAVLLLTLVHLLTLVPAR